MALKQNEGIKNMIFDKINVFCFKKIPYHFGEQYVDPTLILIMK